MKNKKNAILQKAARLFYTHGTQSISMDDVARECNLSKKTLYQFIDNKDQLVNEALNLQLDTIEKKVFVCNAISPDAITEMKYFFNCIEEMLELVSPALPRDLKKHFPGTYDAMMRFQDEKIAVFVQYNLIRGISEQLYRTEVGKDSTARMYCWALQKAVEDNFRDIKKEVSLIKSINNIFLHNIVNPNGKKMLISR